MNSQLKDLEDEMAEKERLKEKSSSTWAMTVINLLYKITKINNKLGCTYIHPT